MKKFFGIFILTALFIPSAAFAEWGYWHAPEVFILRSGKDDVHVAQLGPEPTRGTRSAMQCQVLAFYKNGKPLKTYSRYDIVRISPSLDAPAAHYEVLGRAHGFRLPPAGRLVFEVEDYKGDILTFDAETGEWIKP